MEHNYFLYLLVKHHYFIYNKEEYNRLVINVSKKEMHIPINAQYIVDTLNNNGYEAYLVGGCVRDCLMGREAHDWDITTDAEPVRVKQLFKNTYDTGIQHGTVTVRIKEETFEVTTYRVEENYQDARRPCTVHFSKEIIKDLQRRDFTMNAIAFHPKQGFVDPFGGSIDIDRQLIRCVGNAKHRFEEDALRMLRAVRFSSQLGFDIDPDTLEAIKINNSLIQKISAERIREEIDKILLSCHVDKIRVLADTGILACVMPELVRCFNTPQHHSYHIYDAGTHALMAVQQTPKDLMLRWVMLLHDIGKPISKTTDEKGIDHFYNHAKCSVEIARKILKRLRFDNKSTEKVLRLIKWHDRPVAVTEKAIRRAVRDIGQDNFVDFLYVKEADIRAQNPVYLQPRLEALQKIRALFKEIQIQGQCMTLKQLSVNGKDLMACGIEEGKWIGGILHKLLDIVIENPNENEREILLAYAIKLYEKEKNKRV